MIKRSTFSRLLQVSFLALGMSSAAMAQDAETSETQEPPATITLTLPDGSKTTLLPSTIIRIRKAIQPETQSGARTRIDWLQLLLVREAPEDVAALVEESVPSLAKLRMPEGSPIWFRAGLAQGPMPLTPEQTKNGVRSAIVLGNNLYFLGSTPEEVRQELNDKGGGALPEPQAVASLPPQKASTAAQTAPPPAKAAPQNAQPRQGPAQSAPQPVQQSQQEQAALPVGEIIRLQHAPQLTQPQQEQAVQVGEIVRLQQQAPQLTQPQQEQAVQVDEIIRLQQAPQLTQPQQEQAVQVGEIIRLQQTPQLNQPQQEQAAPVGEITRLQQAQLQEAQRAFSTPIEEPLIMLDGFTEFLERTPQGRPVSKRDRRR